MDKIRRLGAEVTMVMNGLLKLSLIGAILSILAAVPQAVCAPPRPNQTVYVLQRRVQYGIASWYGTTEQGRLMASGERFDENALIGAHRSLPFGTQVTVTKLRNGRSVTVRIKDRGPALTSRVIDLSRAAAMRLGFLNRGLTPVRVTVVSLPPAKQNHSLVSAEQN